MVVKRSGTHRRMQKQYGAAKWDVSLRPCPTDNQSKPARACRAFFGCAVPAILARLSVLPPGQAGQGSWGCRRQGSGHPVIGDGPGLSRRAFSGPLRRGGQDDCDADGDRDGRSRHDATAHGYPLRHDRALARPRHAASPLRHLGGHWRGRQGSMLMSDLSEMRGRAGPDVEHQSEVGFIRDTIRRVLRPLLSGLLGLCSLSRCLAGPPSSAPFCLLSACCWTEMKHSRHRHRPGEES